MMPFFCSENLVISQATCNYRPFYIRTCTPLGCIALQTFPRQALSRTDISRTSYAKEFSCT